MRRFDAMHRLLQSPALWRARRRFSGSHSNVEHFHKQRERHREIGVTLRNVEAETFGDEIHADQKKEAECKHLYRGMPFHEATYRASEDHHDNNRKNYCNDHDGNFVDHSDSSDHRIQREYEIEQTNLDENSEQ